MTNCKLFITSRPTVLRATPVLAPVFVTVAAFTAGCTGDPGPDPDLVTPEVLAEEHAEWRANRHRSLTNPAAGVISWAGLWALAEGPNRFGSDPSLAIVLPPEDAPPFAGTLHLENGEVRLVPEAESGLTLDVASAVTEELPLRSDRQDNTTILALGSLGLRIHSERGTDRLWLRVWDRDAPRLAAFQLPDYFPVSTDWRLPARFDPYPEPRIVPLADVRGGTVENESPGELVFEVGDREHRLVAFARATSSSYFISLWDSTAVSDTYQGGRYMRVPRANDQGWTVIDFNRAYNPPCVFTPFSVCSLPPRDNRLQVAVTAGEKRPAEPAY
ncbi:MAG: DUF1684 domain-containing protein [Gemmatimonadota bacterium]|nr:DUF1684 domain-containing protein [Gemmatimonadota bacterium]